MIEKDDDIIVKKMAGLLRQGATMLDLSCPVCNQILFRLKNESIFCPNCEKEVIIQKEQENNTNENSIEKSNGIKIEKTSNIKIKETILNNLLEKVLSLTILLKNENQISILRDLSELIENLVSIINRL